MDDVDLVRLVLEGDGRAFTTLVDRHAPACLRYATRMLGSRDDAEDAAQETFLRAHRAIAMYDPRTPLRTWLFAILINRCRTTLLHRSRRLRRVVIDNGAVTQAVQPSDDLALQLREDIARALAGLDSDQREAFLLKHVEQLSYDEMATITGVGVSALKMRVKRACTRLQGILKENGHGGD